jgi:hypothetical protein
MLQMREIVTSHFASLACDRLLACLSQQLYETVVLFPHMFNKFAANASPEMGVPLKSRFYPNPILHCLYTKPYPCAFVHKMRNLNPLDFLPAGFLQTSCR